MKKILAQHETLVPWLFTKPCGCWTTSSMLSSIGRLLSASMLLRVGF